MENNVTELVFILDRSGSMAGMEADTIGGFNAMIERQKALPGTVYVSTVLFDSHCQVLHDRVDIQDIQPMTLQQYQVGGCTALLDAIGGAIHHIGNVHKYARKEDVPGKTIFVITTDGMENASRLYQADEVRRMVRDEEEKYGWEFLFVAANIDAVQTAANIGIRRERAANYRQTQEGTRAVYEAMDCIVSAFRCNEPMAEQWKQKLEEEEL